ncbi:hypothetical protein [Streptomyces sp. DH24]|uniref:hypothetical protein n=1 Tax=Streptomyces sp. DH24 TaxID=3040123 RepID=UPI002441F738|nr:hypothetical protein [Streptomyces sp. DH24]MDG9716872.1 hypothetical protein [Streptomyces sp. DH24]
MLRHEFQPGRLVAGLFLTLGGVLYAGDAGGAWDTPWFVLIPVVMGGLCLAGATAVVAGGIRRRRRGARRGTPEEANTPH